MINEYLNQLEAHLKRIDIFADYSFSYKIDQDAGTLKIWINATFSGDSRFDGLEFVVFTLQKNKFVIISLLMTVLRDGIMLLIIPT